MLIFVNFSIFVVAKEICLSQFWWGNAIASHPSNYDTTDYDYNFSISIFYYLWLLISIIYLYLFTLRTYVHRSLSLSAPETQLDNGGAPPC